MKQMQARDELEQFARFIMELPLVYPVTDLGAAVQALGGPDATVEYGDESYEAGALAEPFPEELLPIESAEDLFVKAAHLQSLARPGWPGDLDQGTALSPPSSGFNASGPDVGELLRTSAPRCLGAAALQTEQGSAEVKSLSGLQVIVLDADTGRPIPYARFRLSDWKEHGDGKYILSIGTGAPFACTAPGYVGIFAVSRQASIIIFMQKETSEATPIVREARPVEPRRRA